MEGIECHKHTSASTQDKPVPKAERRENFRTDKNLQLRTGYFLPWVHGHKVRQESDGKVPDKASGPREILRSVGVVDNS